MTSQEAYKKFLLKVNKNDTNANVKISKGLFVLIFNEQKRKWVESTIRKEESSDYIDGIEELLELDVELTKISESSLKDDFAIPTNFYCKTSSYTLASTKECKEQVLVNWFIKPKNLNVLLQNADYSPSFDYRETLAILNNDKLSVYKDGFTIDKAFLNYYREPKDIDIEGYKHIDGTPSVTINPDLSNVNTETIIDLSAAEAVRNYESLQQLQIALQRVQENKQ